MGLRPDGTIVREHTWTVSQEVPVIVEVVDGPRHVEKLLARVEPAMQGAAPSRSSGRTSCSTGAASPARKREGRGAPLRRRRDAGQPARHWR